MQNFKIPLPPLATQQAIVAEIEAEQALVAANRELITRFEQKIQATLARIWGEEEARRRRPEPWKKPPNSPTTCRSPSRPKEQEYIEFLWDAFETNYANGKYQFAFLAYHMLTMSFVYFNIWQIKQTQPEDFEKGLIGFARTSRRVCSARRRRLSSAP